jgi:hypothetical protein
VLLGPQGQWSAAQWVAQQQVEGFGILNVILPMGDAPPYVFLVPTKDIDLVFTLQAVAPDAVVYTEPADGWRRGPRAFLESQPDYILGAASLIVVGVIAYLALR